MGLTETLLFYLLMGGGVSIATVASTDKSSTLGMAYRAIAALFFWPLFIPLLLTPISNSAPKHETREEEAGDELAKQIQQVETELDSALASLDGWSEGALARERIGIDELRLTWKSQAARIREMDRLLSDVADAEQVSSLDPTGDRAAHSEQARQANFKRLRAVRDRAFDDLTSTLARVRELVSLIHLAKFTGAPASRAEDLVAQIAAAVEGLSEVAGWRDHEDDREPLVAAAM